MKSNIWARLVASAGVLTLMACGGGGSGAALNPGGSTITPPPSTQTQISFGVLGVGYRGNAPTLATGTTPNFTTNLPANGTSFALDEGGLVITRTSNESSIPPNNITVNGLPGAGTATFEGTTTSGGITYPVLGLSIPSLNINATGLRGDGTSVMQADGSKVGAVVTGLTYTLLGAWTSQSANGSTAAFGLAVAGYQTPNANVPTTGTATYIGNNSTGATAGGVVGTVIMQSGSDNVAAATLTGNVSLNVNFATQEANGTLTNMTAKDVVSGATSPWNNVTLTGKLGSNDFSSAVPGAYITGSASPQAAPAGATFGMSTSAQGFVQGALFGPNANEAGAAWSLNDNGKSAVGIFGATKQ